MVLWMEVRRRFWALCLLAALLLTAWLLSTRKTRAILIAPDLVEKYCNCKAKHMHLSKKPRDRAFDGERRNAAIVVLVRNSDLEDLVKTMINFEDRFNLQFKYPYVLLNDKPFEASFEKTIRRLVAGGSGVKVSFGRVPIEHWSFPPWIDQKRAAQARIDMADVLYGDSESYRFMCRYFSGFFFDNPLLAEYSYYWRLEPGVRYLCNIPYDPFLLMEREKKMYGFVLSFPELPLTVPTLMNATLAFQKDYPELLNKNRNWFSHFQEEDGTFNLCHFWSNFEIASFDFYRSPAYRAYFAYLDRAGGFFYERWGDAPVHSLAVGMFLKPEEVLYFKDMGYRHPPFKHCPADAKWREQQECTCDPERPSNHANEWCIQKFLELPYRLKESVVL